MDEILHNHNERLKTIEYRLSQIDMQVRKAYYDAAKKALRELHQDLKDMIAKAEEEYRRF